MQNMSDRLRKIEVWGIMFLMVFHVVLFPLGVQLGYGFGLIPADITDSQLNIAYYGIGLLFTFVFAGKYLRRSFDNLLDTPIYSLLCIILAWAVYLVLFLVVNTLIANLSIFDIGNPNQETIQSIADADMRTVVAFTVFMAPIVEEVIFRGGVFCGLYYKNRTLAYVLSVLAFSVYHVWQYALFGDIRTIIFAIQYVPAAIALCWCYERSGSIWACIFFHMSMNIWGLSAL